MAMKGDGGSKNGEFKITVLGSGGVGKSAMSIRFITGEYEANYDPTIEDSYRKQCAIDGEAALMDILDTAGQEEYAALQDQWIREGDGFLIVYAINSAESFSETTVIRDKIIRILDADGDDCKVPICLVGNKCDLEDERKVTKEEGEEQGKLWNSGWFEASAKDTINIEESFFDVVRRIRKNRAPPEGKKKKAGKKGGMCTLL